MKPVTPITTRVGHYSTDELRFRGHRVFAELLGHSTFGQMLMLGISGRRLTEDDVAIIDDIMTAMSSADPRLWPFKLTRLASSYGVGGFGVAATLAGSQGGIFGPNRLQAAAEWLVQLQRGAGPDGCSDDSIVSALERGGQGFGVLYRTRDERFEALMIQVTKRGRHERPHTRLCLRATQLARQRKLEVHVYLGIAALCLDLGLSPHEIGIFGVVVLLHDALANAAEGSLQQPAVLRALPRDRVDYRGPQPRTSPACAEQDPPSTLLAEGDDDERQ
jgi:hypothetical protein